MLHDQPRLRRRLGVLLRRNSAADGTQDVLAEIMREVCVSRLLREHREQMQPVLQFPTELPISQRREDIAKALSESQTVVICGETGSGKTTQLPKICLSLGRGRAGLIGHTQPRRIAARTVAKRIAEELDEDLGHLVGYKVRFNEHVHENTLVKLMTDGILLAETRQDRLLRQYDTIIIDEAHERSLNIDFLLGYLRQILPKRPDLKVIVTSATIDPQRFSRHFGEAPVIEVSGRTYPVEVRYRPIAGDDNERDRDIQQAIPEAVDELCGIGRGDILVFLSGEREIRETAETLRKHPLRHTEILPLYARLSLAEQTKAFRPHSGTRIILATNVAETSLTVPGIRYVVDPGYARISRYSRRSKVQRLPVEAISQASANQRAGRCGRLAAGVCVRLYSEDDYLSRAEFTPPEIQRTNLASVILQMAALGFGNVERFPFVDPPDRRFVNDGFRLLHELGAVDEQRSLTPLGRQLARLPVDPRIGRMVLAAVHECCLREVLVIAAVLSIQDPRERPMELRQAADEKHSEFADRRSDFLGFVRLWEWFQEQRRHLTQSKLRAACRERFLSFPRMREWGEVYAQLRDLVKREKSTVLNQEPAGYEAVHRALLSGLLGNIASRDDRAGYLGARNNRLQIFPGSALRGSRARWIAAGELLETSRLYAVTCARIDPAWVEQLAAHLVRRSYSEPHWQRRRGQVVAYESVTLYGLTLVSRRRVDYGRVAPQEARTIFIRSALVEGEFDGKAGFFRHNCALAREIEQLENKARRRDILADEDTLFSFYDERIPSTVCSAASLDRWLRRAQKGDPNVLRMDRGLLMCHEAEGLTGQAYPDRLHTHGLELPLRYVFEPGSEHDGVAVTLPIAMLNQVRAERFEWLIPGLRQELVTALIRSLPKSLRKSFVPAPDFAAACVQAITPEDGPLLPALTRQLQRMTGVLVPAEEWRLDTVPEHLRMLFEVVDDGGAVLEQGRDLRGMQHRLHDLAQERFRNLPEYSGASTGRTMRWSFGDLPERVEVARQGVRMFAYPSLEDCGDAVCVVPQDSPSCARAVHRKGLRRLFALQVARRIKAFSSQMQDSQRMCLQYSIAPPAHWCEESPTAKPAKGTLCDELREMVIGAVVQETFLWDGVDIRDGATFETRLQAGRGRLEEVGREIGTLLGSIFKLWQEVNSRLLGVASLRGGDSIADLRSQLQGLLYRGFIEDVAVERLRHYPRYLRGILRRLDRLRADPATDTSKLHQVEDLWAQCLQAICSARKTGDVPEDLEAFRWIVEEFRISLFAQELRAAMPVSRKRLQEQWKRVKEAC
jgi:ATP-dependent helicase HrpA